MVLTKKKNLILLFFLLLMQENIKKFDTRIWSNDPKGWIFSCRSSSWKHSYLQGHRGKGASDLDFRSYPCSPLALFVAKKKLFYKFKL